MTHKPHRHLVPWSIQSRPTAELDQLLASGSYFARIIPSVSPNEYPAGIQPNRDFQEAPQDEDQAELIGDPRVGFDFLSGKTSVTHAALDYGWMCGYWKKTGASKLAELYDVCMDYELCGLPWLEYSARHPRAKSFLANLAKLYKGGFANDQLPLAQPIKDESERAAAALKAAGGSEQFLKLAAERKSKLGNNLLPAEASKQ